MEPITGGGRSDLIRPPDSKDSGQQCQALSAAEVLEAKLVADGLGYQNLEGPISHGNTSNQAWRRERRASDGLSMQCEQRLCPQQSVSPVDGHRGPRCAFHVAPATHTRDTSAKAPAAPLPRATPGALTGIFQQQLSSDFIRVRA